MKYHKLFFLLFIMLHFQVAAQKIWSDYRRSNIQFDTETPLPFLIEKLDKGYELLETGKSYWIGYNDLMYSIAAYKSSAIGPLLTFYNKAKTWHGKAGAILTLHLIGIESRIAGRIYEEFVDTTARDALLQLASDTAFTGYFASLLTRDPWPSDLSVMARLLREQNNPVLINSFFRYFRNTPFKTGVPFSLDTINIHLVDSNGIVHLGKMLTIAHRPTPVWQGSSSLTKRFNDTVPSILQYSMDSGEVFRKFFPEQEAILKLQALFPCHNAVLVKGDCQVLNEALDILLFGWSIGFDSDPYMGSEVFFQYYLSDNNIFICTKNATRKIWIDFLASKGY